MSSQPNIVITGAAGFIGSSLVTEMNRHNIQHLFLVDNFSGPEKDQFINGKSFQKKIDAPELFTFLESGAIRIDFVFHLGGKTANKTDFTDQNVDYPKKLFSWCRLNGVPFIYASSAATYGSGNNGYDDDEKLIPSLHPLSEYGKSKHAFDLWMMHQQPEGPWAGLKIFNAFGPNEYRKGRSASVAFKSFFEIRDTGRVVLFDSSDKKFGPGDQLRDFIYIKDIVKVLYGFFERWQRQEERFPSGIFNVGTGVGSSFNDVAGWVFDAMGIPRKIAYKPIPEAVLVNYPENMIAKMDKLRSVGLVPEMWTPQAAINDLVNNYLKSGKIF